jgi:hypothetical protein
MAITPRNIAIIAAVSLTTMWAAKIVHNKIMNASK